jgi:hypothetical protein
VEPVRLPLPLLGQRLAVAGQVAELADRLGRHEAGSQQPVLEQLAQPLRIGHIGLAPRHVLDLAGVAEQKLEVVLEQVPDRLPVDAGSLHRHVRHAKTLQLQRLSVLRATATTSSPSVSGRCSAWIR